MSAHGTTGWMSEDPSAKKSSSAATWSMVIAAALLGYLLFPGVFFAFCTRGGWVPPPAFEKQFTILYSPLSVLEKWDAFGEFYAWYINSCAGREIYIAPSRASHAPP